MAYIDIFLKKQKTLIPSPNGIGGDQVAASARFGCNPCCHGFGGAVLCGGGMVKPGRGRPRGQQWPSLVGIGWNVAADDTRKSGAYFFGVFVYQIWVVLMIGWLNLKLKVENSLP